MPIPKKKEKRGATSSTCSPALSAVLMYSRPSAIVNANSSFESAPASYMWYPEIEIELNFGISFEVYSIMSEMIRIEGAGG